MPDRPDLLTQLERYGTVLEDAARATEPDSVPGERPRRRRAAATIAVAAAVLLVLAGLALANRPRPEAVRTAGTVDETAPQPDPVSDVPPPLPGTGHRRVLGILPAGLVPSGAAEGEMGADRGIRNGAAGRPGLAVQVFVVREGGTEHRLRVESGATRDAGSRLPPTGTTLRGMPALGNVLDGGSMVSAGDGRVGYEASAPTLPVERLVAVVDALVARPAGVAAGLDAPAGSIGGATVTLVEEHVAPPGLPAPSRAWYRVPGTDRAALVEAYPEAPGAGDALLEGTRGAQVRVLAGKPRFVVDSTIDWNGTWRVVTWIEDGVQVVVRTRGLNDADQEAVVAAVRPADNQAWLGQQAQSAADLGRDVPAATLDLPVGRLTVHRRTVERRAEMGPPPTVLHAACLEVPNLAPLCQAGDADIAENGVDVVGPWGTLTPRWTGTYVFYGSAVVGGRWFVFGWSELPGEWRATADGQPLPLETRTAENLQGFAAEVPAGVDTIRLASPFPVNQGPGVFLTRP